jgi:hypothetical protein
MHSFSLSGMDKVADWLDKVAELPIGETAALPGSGTRRRAVLFWSRPASMQIVATIDPDRLDCEPESHPSRKNKDAARVGHPD